jgi:hypothetical protein
LAFAIPFLFTRFAVAEPPTRLPLGKPPGQAGSVTALPQASQRYAWRSEEACDLGKEGVPIVVDMGV